jgi:hypothetical protein
MLKPRRKISAMSALLAKLVKQLKALHGESR